MATRDSQDVEFNLGDLWGVIRRRFLWFLVPLAVSIGAAGVLAMSWPALYEAASTILIEPMEIPPDLVASTVGNDTEARFSQIKFSILARDNLAEVIEKFDLYGEMDAPMEERVIRMREFVAIEPLPPAIVDPRKPLQIESFRIAFRDEDPALTVEVTNELTREFVSANLESRSTQAEGTSEFIDSELERTRRERARVSSELSAYRQEHAGELPDDMVVNQQRLDRMSTALGTTLAQLDMAQTQVTRIRAQIDELRTSGVDQSYDPVRRKHTLELELRQHLALGKTEKHPDLIVARSELEQLEELIADVSADDRPISPQESSLRRELRENEVRAASLQREKQRVEAGTVEVEEQIAAIPGRAAEIGRIEAQYQSLTETILVLQQKKVAADMGRSVELSQKGEKFRIIDTPVLPESPVSPNRPLFVVVGLLVGVMIGLSLLAIREMMDSSFHTSDDLQSTLGLPVLGTIPVIEVAGDRASLGMRLRRLTNRAAV